MRIALFLSALILGGCGVTIPKNSFGEKFVPTAPDYSKPGNWASLPSKEDPADRSPRTAERIESKGFADVFFLHPTTYIKAKGAEDRWNASITDQELNAKTDASAILYQASIFNEAGRIYAPRYRQAHYGSYFTTDKSSAIKAFEVAYQDIASAFEYYLENHNEGRPIVIAGHSQGTTHAIRLLQEYFDGKKLADKLVVAYLVGMPVTRDTFSTIKQCQTAIDVGCFCSWRTFKKGHLPKQAVLGEEIAVNNPLNWEITTTYAPKELNKGGVARKFEGGIIPEICDATICQGILWASKPKFPGSIFLTRKNYHIADYNLFYTNIAENVKRRAIQYIRTYSQEVK